MAHIHEKIDFTASVFIVRDNKVLMHFHKKTGRWLQPGGHIELDEDPNQAAIREAKEETGFDIELIGHPQSEAIDDATDIIPPRFLNRHRFNDVHEHIDLAYFARIVGGAEMPEDDVEIRWLSRNQLNEMELLPAVRMYALAALDELAT